MATQDPVQPGQLTAVPASNYDVNQDLGRVIDRTNVVDAPTAPNLLFNSGVPITADGESKVNPLYSNYLNVLKNTPTNSLTQPYYTNLDVTERYSDDSIGGYNPYDLNQENWYGENQSWLNQWGNRVGKFTTKALGSFANSLMDIPNMINAASEGNIDKLWNNPINTWATDMMEWSEKVMPNYKTNWESEHPFLNLIPFYGNSGNGWGNVFEQVGFTVGAIGGAVVEDLAVASVTGGVGEIPLAATQINKAVYNLGKLINRGDDAMDALRTSIRSSDDIIRGLKGIDRFNYGVRQGLWGANMITSGFAEAAFEGIESYRTLSKDLNQEFFETNGRLAGYDEGQVIENTAKDAANARFIMNSALLAATNTIQWGGLLRPFNSVKDLVEAEAKAGVNIGLREGSIDVFEAIAPTAKLARLGNALKNNVVANTLLKSSSEGFEEGAQFAIQNGVNDYYKRKYNGDAIDFTNNFIKSFGNGLSKTLGTQEGWENIVYGLLGGAMYKGGEHVYYKTKGLETPNYKKQVESVIQGLNSQSLTGIFENKYAENVAATSIETDMKNAAKSGNVFQYQNYKHEQFTNFVLSGIKQNKFDTRMEQLNELKKLDETEFQKTFGIPFTEENKRNVSSYVDAMLENANYINDVSKRVNRTFVNPFNYKGTGHYKNLEQKQEQDRINENYLAYEGVKEQLVYSMSVAKNSTDRINSLRQDIANSTISTVTPNLIINLSSEEGLAELKKEYKQQLKIYQDSAKLDGKDNNSKDANWYNARIQEIEDVLNEKDANKQNLVYNKLVSEVFDRMQFEADTLANSGTTFTPQPFPKPLMVDLLNMGKDISYLKKRSELAIKNYAGLTTKGGFKKLFDEIIELRNKVAAEQVDLKDEALQATNPQQQAVLDTTQATTNITPSNNPPSIEEQGGLDETTTTALTPEQILELNQVLVDVSEGKKIATEFELEFLGFKTIDDLKFDDPKLDVSKYIKVKSLEGKNMYISKDVIDKAKSFLKGVNNVADPVVNTPNPVIAPIETAPLRTEDFIAKVFVPNDLKVAFNNAIFSGTREEVKKDLSVSVKALSPEFQSQYDDQKAKGTYSPIKEFPGVYVSKAPIDISIEHKGIEIGKVMFPDRLLFEMGGKLVTLNALNPKRYQELTGKTPAQYKADLEDYKKQLSFKNFLALKYKNNNYSLITINSTELNNLIDVSLTYGELDLVTKEIDRPLYKDLKFNTVTLPTIDGASIDTMVILSIPKRYISDTGTRERTEFINVIYGQNFYENSVDDKSIRDLINTSPEKFLATGSRYVGLVQKPDGNITPIALRPAEMTSSTKEELFSSIKNRAELSAKTNLIESTEEESTGKLLVGDKTFFYKLPNDQAKAFNDNFNTDLNNTLFITDANAKSWLNLSVSPIGALRLEIYEPTTEYSTTIYINPQRVANINSLADMIEAFNKEIKKQSLADFKFAELNINLSSSNFRQNITDDALVRNAEELANLTTAATSAEVFKNGTMRILPDSSSLVDAYKVAGGRTKGDVLEEIKQYEQTGPTGLDPLTIATAEQFKVPYAVVADIENRRNNELANTTGQANLDAVNNKYDAELQTISDRYNISGEQASTTNEAITGGPFSNITQIPLSEKGELVPQDIQDVSSPVANTLLNQEDLTGVEFNSVKDALAANDIGYRIKDNITEFYNISTNEKIDFLEVTPVELAKQLGLKVKAAPKKDSTEDFDFKLGENGSADLSRMIDIEKAKSYIYTTVPSFIKVEDINTILDKISIQGEAWGAFSNGVIYLNQAAESGVEYHEAFHAIFRTALTDEEITNYLSNAQSELYTKLKKQGKSINNLLAERKALGLYNNISNAEAYNRIYEEYLADKFQSWKQGKENAGFFDKLFDLIRKVYKWLLRDKTSLDALFYKIDRGTYRYSEIASNRFTQESNDEFSQPEFAFMLVPARPGKIQAGSNEITIKRNLDTKTSKQVIQQVAAYFNTYRALPKFRGESDEKVLNTILDDLRKLYSVNNPLYAGYSEEQMNNLVNSDKSFIYANEESRSAIKEGAKNYIESIRYIEQFQEEEQDDSEQDTGSPSTGYDNRTENVGGFSSLPGLLRQYIGFTSYDVVDEFGNTELIEGVPVLATVDAISVYYGLMRAVANINDPIRFFQKMIRFADGNEQSRHFVEKFIDDTGLNVDVLMNENKLEATKNNALVEIVRKGFNKYRIDYIFTEHDIKQSISKSFSANRRNVENVQFDKWSNSFVSGYANYNEDSQKNIRQTLNDVRNKYFDERRIIKYNTEALNNATLEIKSALRSVGIQLSNDYIKYSLLAVNAKRFDELKKSYEQQGTELSFDDVSNKFITKQDYDYIDIMKIADEITLNSSFLEELARSLAANTNPYFKEIKKGTKINDETDQVIEVDEEIDTAMVSRILNVARGNAQFDETVGESSYTNAENKVVYSHQDGTFNVKFSYALRDANFRKQLREKGYREEISAYRDTYDKEWLTENFLLNSPSFENIADNLLFQRIDGLRAVERNQFGKIITEEFRDQKEGVTYGAYSPREFLVNFMNFYVSYSKTQKGVNGDIVTAPHLIRVLEASKTGDTVNLPINTDLFKINGVTDKAVDILFKEFNKEFNRIQKVSTEIGSVTDNIVESYHTGSFAEDGFTITKGYRGLKFTDNITSLLSPTSVANLEKKARTNNALTLEEITKVKEDIAANLNKMVDDTLDVMVREGVIKRDTRGIYSNAFLHLDFFRGNPTINLVPVDVNAKFKVNIGHVLINDYVNTLAYNQILHGDSALGLKNDGGIDAVKRAKGDNAAITSIRTDLIDASLGITEPFTHSSVAIFKEPTSNDGIKVADAQMYTTVKGLRYTLWGLGRLTPRLANVLDALERGEDIHNLKNENGKVYDAVFDRNDGLLRWDEMTNSLKLVYKDGKTYFKMSVVVLQPSLTSYTDSNGDWVSRPGWETLHNLRVKMENDGVHFSAPESASKMMTLDVSKAKDFSDLKGHLYDNTYFGLQTENPSNKLEITTPTQLLQLIDSEQDNEIDVYFQGRTIKVGELKNAYQNFVSQKVSNAYELVKQEIYKIEDFNQDIETSIAEGKVTPRLAKFQARAIETLESSGSDAQLLDFFSLDENGVPKYNLNMSSTKLKFQQLYLAYFSRGVLSQKSPGYTVALMSGIDTKTIRKATKIVDGVITEWEHVRREQWDTNFQNIQAERIMRSPEEVVEEGQYYIDELRYNVAEYDADGNITGYYSEMMLPAHYREFLDIPRDAPLPEAITKGFGVRIPSQDKHSFMSLKIIDFLPANLGSTGMFPKELIALSGADFDIDKEFISRYDFYMKKNERGVTKFSKYGDAVTDGDKWEEYKMWMGKNNKVVKELIKEIALNDADYQQFISKDINTIDVLGEVFDLDASKKIRAKYFDKFTATALGQLNLPSTLEEFIEASKTKELNNGVLTNKIVDSYIALLTNKGMQEIAKTPATLTALANIQDEEDIIMRDKDGNVLTSVFSRKNTYPVDSMVGKYYAFRNNTTGKNNIGIDVNANLIYSVLNKGEIRNTRPLVFDGITFDSFSGNNEYNLSTGQFDGKRTNDILSTLITSATDEAKEQLNALYNLSADALKVVNYLVSLKVPLKTAIYMVNQPSIRNYLEIKAVKQNTLQTQAEERIFRTVFVEEAMKKLDEQIKPYFQQSDEDIYNTLERLNLVEEDC